MNMQLYMAAIHTKSEPTYVECDTTVHSSRHTVCTKILCSPQSNYLVKHVALPCNEWC